MTSNKYDLSFNFFASATPLPPSWLQGKYRRTMVCKVFFLSMSQWWDNGPTNVIIMMCHLSNTKINQMDFTSTFEGLFIKYIKINLHLLTWNFIIDFWRPPGHPPYTSALICNKWCISCSVVTVTKSFFLYLNFHLLNKPRCQRRLPAL